MNTAIALPSPTIAHPLAPLLPSALRTRHYLIFLVDSQPYACPVDDIDRLIRQADADLLPAPTGAPAWQVGQLQLDSQASTRVPVISLRALWGLPALDEAKDEQFERLRRALLVVTIRNRSFALQVDACLSVSSNLPVEGSRFRLPGALKGAQGAAFQSATPWQRSLLVIVEVPRLLAGTDMEPLSLTAA